MFEESQCEIARATADVKHRSVRLYKRGMECERGAAPPELVDVRREDVIEKVVSWGDGVEHLLHSLGCVGLILNAHRLCA
jgi:hypothetical protein